MIASIISDVSRRHGAIGYCFVILDHGEEWHQGDISFAGSLIAAEIVSLAMALETFPPGATVVAYTDLNWLPSFLAGEPLSYSHKHKIPDGVERFIAASQGLRVQIQIVDRKNVHYRRCHSRARIEAVRAAKSHGTWLTSDWLHAQGASIG